MPRYSYRRIELVKCTESVLEMSSMEQQRARERSPGTESFYSAREEDTASLASFYMDAYDDLTTDEFQSAEESERETTPLGRDSSAESTPRQTPLREARRDELPKQFEKRHSHDYGSVFHREVGKPLVLQRSSSYMRDGPFEEQSKMQRIRSYSSVDYLNDSYDQSRPGRRPPPDRKRQRQISLERMAQKERGRSAEPELRSEIRLAFESPFDVPLPKGDELEKLKKRLSSLTSTEDEKVCETSPPTSSAVQSNESEAPPVPRRTRMRDSFATGKSEAIKPLPPPVVQKGDFSPPIPQHAGTVPLKSLEPKPLHTSETAELSEPSTDEVFEGTRSGEASADLETEPRNLKIGEINHQTKLDSDPVENETDSPRKNLLNSLEDERFESWRNDSFKLDSFSFLSDSFVESSQPVDSPSIRPQRNSGLSTSKSHKEESFEIIPAAPAFDVDHVNPPTQGVRSDKSETGASFDAHHTPSMFSGPKTVFKENTSLFRDSAPKFSRTLSFDSTPVFDHKPMGSFDLQFDLDRSPSREPSPLIFTAARPTRSSPPRDDGALTRSDSFSDLSFSSWRTPMRRKERARSPPLPLRGRPPPGRNSFVAPVGAQDIPKRPARTKRGARSAGASRQHSVTRDETRDSTRDLQEQIQNLLSSLQKKLNRSTSLGRSPNFTDENAKYDSDGRNSITASNSSLSWKPTRYSSIRREATMEKLENLLSTSSETKKNIPAVFDAESIEELTTYGHIGNYEAADKKDSKIFEEFDKHFDLMLEADSGEEDDFVKIVDESHAAQSFRMSVLNGNKEKSRRGSDLPDLNNTSFESNKTVSPFGIDKSFDSGGPPPVPAKRRSSRISAQSQPAQQIIEMQNEQLRELQKHQEELERKMKLLQEQIELRKALDEERAPSIPAKCKSSKVVGSAEGFYNVLSYVNPANYHERVILPSDEDFLNLQTSLIDWEASAFDLNGQSIQMNPSVFHDATASRMQTNCLQQGS